MVHRHVEACGRGMCEDSEKYLGMSEQKDQHSSHLYALINCEERKKCAQNEE